MLLALLSKATGGKVANRLQQRPSAPPCDSAIPRRFIAREFAMTKQEAVAHLAERKAQLAKKYDSLANVSKSRPKRDRYLRSAAKYRRQAADLERLSRVAAKPPK